MDVTVRGDRRPRATAGPPGPRVLEGRPGRVPALDVARGLGVVAMVAGHTLDALLSPAARAHPAVVAYWKARGLTAPLFMMVAGWAVALAITRSGARGPTAVRARLPRVLLLLSLGYFLRFPGWDVQGLLQGSPATWEHFLAFDALHAIAAGLACVAVTLALPWSRREQGLWLVLLAVVAVTLGMRPPSIQPSTLPALALAQAVGGTSPFPVFPWIAYLFCGAAIPLLAGDGAVRRATGLGALGLVLVAATCWQGVGELPPAHPALVLFRVGVVALVLAVLEASPARVAAFVAPLGRRSLSVYAIHLPVVYGWGVLEGLAQRVGPRLSFHSAALVAVVVLAFALAAQDAARAAWRGAVAVTRWVGRRAPALSE